MKPGKSVVYILSFFIVLVLVEWMLRTKDRIADEEILRHNKDIIKNELSSKKRIYRRMSTLFYYDSNGCVRRIPNAICFSKSNDDPHQKLLIRFNSHGIRGHELIEKPDKRILFVGDSVVLSGGVTMKETFVYKLEGMLNPGIVERKDFHTEILNFGIANIGIDQYYKNLKYHGLDFDPDYVFLGFYLNDAVAPQKHVGMTSVDFLEKALNSDILSEIKIIAYIEKMYRRIKYAYMKDMRMMFRWVKRFRRKEYYSNKEDFIRLVEEADQDWGSAWVPENWEKIVFYLHKIKNICEKNNVKLRVFCFPVEPQVYSDIAWDKFDYPQRKLREITKEMAIDYFDLLPYIREYKDIKMFSDQCHYNKAGSTVVAEVIGEIIKNNSNVFEM